MTGKAAASPFPLANTPKSFWDEDSQATESEDLLDDGDIVDGRFVVAEKLQSGSFGQVYLALDKENDDLEVALKIEKPRPEGKRSFCAHEVEVMKRCPGQMHVPQLYGYSTSPPCLYIAMQLMSFTLSELRRTCPSKVMARFSLSTTVRVAIQSFLATRDLHAVGVIHRDIKPSNFMMGGTASTKRCVYLLDFGLSRVYRDQDGELIPAREKPGFVGSTRYASLGAHEGRELGRGDDLLSLLYVVVEMRCGRLPWKNVGDKYVVAAVKRTTTLKKLCETLPEEMVEFGRLIQSLLYPDDPPYDRLEALLRKITTDNGISFEDPLDWEENFAQVPQEDPDDGPAAAAAASSVDTPM